MEVTEARRNKIEYGAKSWIVSKRNVSSSIFMELTPYPLAPIFGLEMFLDMFDCL
jgi:hypothetical protein